MPYGLDDVNSAKYDDAKALWDSQTRTFTGDLPHSSFWTLNGLSQDQRKDYLDSGYVAIWFSHVAYLNTKIGSSPEMTMLEYASEHPSVPVLVRDAVGPLRQGNSGTEYHPAYSADGSHIGSGSSVGAGDWSYSTDLRFRNGDTPLDDTLLWTEYDTDIPGWTQPASGFWLMPHLPSSAEHYASMHTYNWNNSAIYGKYLYDQVVAGGVTPVGLQIDWEDSSLNWNIGADYMPYGESPITAGTRRPEYYYERDNRFDQNSRLKFNEELRKYYWGECMMSRLATINDLMPAATGELSVYYDGNPSELIYFDPTGINIMYAYSRKKGNSSLYPYYSSINSVSDLINHYGWRLIQAYKLGWHIWDTWVCGALPTEKYWQSGDIYESAAKTGLSAATFTTDQARARADDPDGVGEAWQGRYFRFQRIRDAIAGAKIMMTLGAIKLPNYSVFVKTSGSAPEFASSPNHGFWSYLIAYDEMQPYHNFIKYGTTYIPPIGICRINNSPIGELGLFRPTVIYGFDYNGLTINPDVVIVCRIWDGNMMFCGASFDSEASAGTVNVKSPTGQSVAVSYSPVGSITIV